MGYTVQGGGNTHDRVDQTFTFLNEAGDDFHLAATDAGARDFGVSLAGDANLAFQTDIDGEQRRITWDIGADEAGSSVGLVGTTVKASLGTAKINASQKEFVKDGLVLMQSFDGPHMDWSQSSAEARDQSGLFHHGDVVGLTQSSVAIGKVGQALRFSGNGYRVTVSSSSDFDISASGGFSNFMWFKKTGACSDGPESTNVFTSRFGTDHGVKTWWFGCESATNKLRIWYLQDAVVTPGLLSATTVNDGNWHFGGWVYDGNADKLYLYLDGVAQETATNIADNFTVANPLCISSYDATCSTFESNNLTLDEIRAYNRALSAAEVDTLYRLGRGNLK
jgi:hypothetical protein